ncbi:MAG TPA: YfiR family protein [Acidobacteriaceae bacterium]|nr:YfiR family protein [Acidobacteriaceae bacterium]
MSLCVADSASFSAGLEKVAAHENVNRRTPDVHRAEHAEDESGRAILFMDATQRCHAEELLQAVAGKSAPTVSALPDFLARDGIIQFQLVARRVGFSVNLDAVNRRHLIISSELLKVAMSVKSRMPEGGAQ